MRGQRHKIVTKSSQNRHKIVTLGMNTIMLQLASASGLPWPTQRSPRRCERVRLGPHMGGPKSSKSLLEASQEASWDMYRKMHRKVLESESFDMSELREGYRKSQFSGFRKRHPKGAPKACFWRPFGSPNRPKVVLGGCPKKHQKSFPKKTDPSSKKDGSWRPRWSPRGHIEPSEGQVRC